jgi:perosamine synthetase
MSTVTAVLHQNAIPIFADIDPESFCLDPASVESVVTKHTKAIIPVHLFGNGVDMGGMMQVAQQHDLFVLEDCAQAHGTEVGGQRVGSIGHAGAFSFYATKHMTTGEGGIITSDDAALLDLVAKLRSHGMSGRDTHEHLGYNYRMNEMQAAMGRVQLGKLETFNQTRIANSLYILEQLAQVRDKWFRVPTLRSNVRHSFFWAPLLLNPECKGSISDVVARLRQRGVEVRHRYRSPLYKQPLLATLTAPGNKSCPFRCTGRPAPDYAQLCLPHVERIAGNVLGLPNHPGLSQQDMDYVIETVVSLYD